MKKKQKRALILVTAVFLATLSLMFWPSSQFRIAHLSMIDTEAPLAGDFTIGDFLTLFSIFAGSVSIGLFLLIFWEKK